MNHQPVWVDADPPQNIDAEQALIGAALLDPATVTAVEGLIVASDFYRPKHEIYWAHLLQVDPGDADRPMALLAALRKTGPLDPEVGPYLHTCMQVGIPAAAVQYAQEIAAKSRHRQAIQAVSRAAATLSAADTDTPGDLDARLYDAMDALEAVAHPERQTALPSWRPVDLTPVLNGDYTPPMPTVGQRDDHQTGLLYLGRQHVIAAESEAGKSWLMLAIAATEMARGCTVACIDFEDDFAGVAGRLLALQVPPEQIEKQFIYLRPDEPLEPVAGRSVLRQLIGDTRPTMVALDGVTEAMTMHGLDPLSNKDAALFGRMLPGAIAALGPAVVSLDHVTKSGEGRGRYQLGAVHKLNGLNGAQYLLDNRTPFGYGLTGKSTIRIAKDRPGQLRKHSLPGAERLYWFGDLVLTSHDQQFAECTIAAPHAKDPDFRPTQVMEHLWRILNAHGPMAQRNLLIMAKGNAKTAREALTYLIVDGFVTDKTPHAVVRPYPPNPTDSPSDEDQEA